MKIDLGTTEVNQRALRVSHETAPQPAPLSLRMNGEIIHPSPVAIEAGHDGPLNTAVDLEDEEKFRLYGELTIDILTRVVPRTCEIARVRRARARAVGTCG